MRVLEIVGCRSSVVRALVAKTRVPGFNSLTQDFFTFSSAFPQTPVNEKVSIECRKGHHHTAYRKPEDKTKAIFPFSS